LIPQKNWWTVFKGLPHSNDESPHETALREFHEETSIALTPRHAFNPEATLHGTVGSGKNKKKLVVYLIKDGNADDESSVCTNQFDVTKVVTIDSGYMKGHPEIVAIQWLSYREAMDGCSITTTADTSVNNNNKPAKIYTSQRGILEDAYQYLRTTRSNG
jgi:8-oxo-dGTP pyrophosphatase MutT (NUDIX family)